LELWRQGRLTVDTLISEKIKPDAINAGFEMLKSGAPVCNLIDFGVV
jgi:S-(hydroxymethyl)glutathione dehydrogenase/alcohol dehydrogenase